MLKQNNFITNLVRVGHIAGMFYRRERLSKTLVIYGLGAPRVPDDGRLIEADSIMKFNVDLFVPDYIGYGRSDGIFTPRNCIKTFLDLYNAFSKGTYAVNNYSNEKLKLKYERIVFIGRSLGGTYLPLLPRFNKNIKDICLVFPAIHNSVYGSIKPEESNEDFMNAMLFDGYKYLYRGITAKIWERHLAEKDDLSPMHEKNIRYLKSANVFIGHGKSDVVLNFSRTVGYFQKIKDIFPVKKNIKLKLYNGLGHNSPSAQKIIEDYMQWLNIERSGKIH